MTRAVVLGGVLAGGFASITLAGSQGQRAAGRGPQSPPVVEIQKVKDNLYMLTGGIVSVNSAALVTASGVVLVDTNFPNYGQAILDKIRTVTDKPVTTIINTHSHGDHVGSNEFFGPNVEIVAHENARPAMEKMAGFKGEKAAFLPKTLFKDKMTLGKGADQIDLYYFGPAHTNNDTWVVFKSARVMHAGDAFPGMMSPLVDAPNGGSALAFSRTLRRAGGLKDVDAIVTGHGSILTMAELKAYERFTGNFVTWATAQKKAGKTVDQAAADYTLPATLTANPYFGVKNWIQTTYTELDAK